MLRVDDGQVSMTREDSWQVEGVTLTLTLLRHVTPLGYAVSVFRFPPSALGCRRCDLSRTPATTGKATS